MAKFVVKGVSLLLVGAGGVLVGIGLTSGYSMPSWWWILCLFLFCAGIFGVMLTEDERPTK